MPLWCRVNQVLLAPGMQLRDKYGFCNLVNLVAAKVHGPLPICDSFVLSIHTVTCMAASHSDLRP